MGLNRTTDAPAPPADALKVSERDLTEYALGSHQLVIQRSVHFFLILSIYIILFFSLLWVLRARAELRAYVGKEGKDVMISYTPA